jgi:hypothetical protein
VVAPRDKRECLVDDIIKWPDEKQPCPPNILLGEKCFISSKTVILMFWQRLGQIKFFSCSCVHEMYNNTSIKCEYSCVL